MVESGWSGRSAPRSIGTPVVLTVALALGYLVVVQFLHVDPGGDSAADVAVFLTTAPAVAILSLLVGREVQDARTVLAIAFLLAALQRPHPNPLPAVIVLGFWGAGLLVGSHRRMAASLRARRYELESQSELHVQEALRYERAHLARELHDVVAHSLSVVVIQASAGQRAADPASARGILTTIADLVDQARTDLRGLAAILNGVPGAGSSPSRLAVQQLVRRTAAVGSPITEDLDDDIDLLPGDTRTLLYRILAEGLVNAVKHAPGAPIELTVRTRPRVRASIRNGHSADPGPVVPGAGRGLAGLTERVGAVHGTFNAGPTSDGGWVLIAEFE